MVSAAHLPRSAASPSEVVAHVVACAFAAAAYAATASWNASSLSSTCTSQVSDKSLPVQYATCPAASLLVPLLGGTSAVAAVAVSASDFARVAVSY